ncbi:hypothetical protein K501DRAFT_261583 [Backusella circina FSU 941]|nr:hypothetical protein K501DRAFT_261583 [Backusella circina FSU 941]
MATHLARTYDIPIEIVDNIAFYLTKKQRGICRTVCRTWQHMFNPSLYRHIKIRGRRQFTQFYASLESDHHLGHYVRRLSVEDVYMTTEELESLPLLVPNLVALCFNGRSLNSSSGTTSYHDAPYNHWKYLRRLTELQDLTVTRHLLRSPLSLLSSLTHLSVRFNNKSTSPLASQAEKSDFISALSNASEIESLSLDSITLSLSEMEAIHTACPNLKKLQLINTELLPIAESIDDKRAVAATTFKPANCMRSFELKNGKDLYENYEWLYFFAQKYPGLEKLKLWCEYSVNDPSHEVPPTPDELEERYGALARLVMSYPYLKSAHFLNITMNHWIFEVMDSVGIKLEELGISDMTDNTIDMLQRLGESNQNPSSLTLWGWPSLCIEETMQETVAVLGECSNRLTDLTFSMRFSGVRNSPIPFDMLLNRCTKLKHLKLDNTQAVLISSLDIARDSLVNSASTFLRPNLNFIEMENGSFRNEIFEYIGLRCPGLDRLEIDSCAYINQGSDTKLMINLPYHAFESIRLSHITAPYQQCFRSKNEISTFNISHGDCQAIYELTDFERCQNSLTFEYEQKSVEDIRATKVQKIDEVDGSFVMVNCKSVKELHLGDFWVV